MLMDNGTVFEKNQSQGGRKGEKEKECKTAKMFMGGAASARGRGGRGRILFK